MNKKKKKSNSGIVIFLASISVIYFIAQGISIISNPIKTMTAIEVTVDDSITATGIFVRNEQVIPAANAEAVEYLVKDGAKVKKGARLATEYSSETALEQSKEIELLIQKITHLKDTKQNLADISDTAKLDQIIALQMQDIEKAVTQDTISSINDESNEIRKLILKRNLSTEDVGIIDEEITKDRTQIERIRSQAQGEKNVIISPYSGYFSEIVDGYESIFSATDIDSVGLNDINKAINSEIQLSDNNMGKIIEDFHWYFATLISKEDSLKLEKGRTYYLRFAQVMDDIRVKAYNILTDDNQALVIFEGSDFSSELVSMRKQNVDIIRRTYSGIKVPKDAIRMVDEEIGVYILNGTVSKFKNIEIIYEGDNYYLIDEESQNAKVVAGDDIIVKAKAIGDKKVVK